MTTEEILAKIFKHHWTKKNLKALEIAVKQKVKKEEKEREY